MKKRSVMMALGFTMTLIVCGGGNAGTTAVLSSGPETQAEVKTEEKTEAGIVGQEEKEESRTEASGDTIILKLSNNQPDRNYTMIATEWFADQMREYTSGKVNIEVYNSGALEDTISCLEQPQYDGMGTVKTNLSTIANPANEYSALMMPYTYKNIEYFRRIHGGNIGMGILHGGKTKEKKLYEFTHYGGGTRCFYNTKKETHPPEDMKGMLVRVWQSELMMSMVEALDGQSAATVYSKVYSALQTGVVDAAENSIVNYLDQSHSGVALYFAGNHHTRLADILVMGEKLREKLSTEDLKIVDGTVLESWEYQKELWTEVKEESRQKLLEQDVTITELTENELKAPQGACEPTWYPHEGGTYKDIIDQIVETGK